MDRSISRIIMHWYIYSRSFLILSVPGCDDWTRRRCFRSCIFLRVNKCTDEWMTERTNRTTSSTPLPAACFGLAYGLREEARGLSKWPDGVDWPFIYSLSYSIPPFVLIPYRAQTRVSQDVRAPKQTVVDRTSVADNYRFPAHVSFCFCGFLDKTEHHCLCVRGWSVCSWRRLRVFFSLFWTGKRNQCCYYDTHTWGSL